MSIEPPRPGEPRRPHGPRNPGDAWVVAPSGERYWGRFGAAGLLAVDTDRGVLLQHRATWSHFGDTWGLPGGARHEGESAHDAALREATEEAGVPTGSVRPRLMSVFELGYWSYATLVGEVTEAFEPTVGDLESHELAWIPVTAVSDLTLHPGFAASWPTLREWLGTRPIVVVDAANVVGSVPDGWWRDRVGAAERLLTRIAALASAGVPAGALDLPADVWFPEWVVVLEGQARGASGVAGVTRVDAEGSGDDAVVAEAARRTGSGFAVTAVTSDRALASRLRGVGADVVGAGWLLDLADERADAGRAR